MTETGNGAGGSIARRPIYLDHQASTPLDPRVREAMLPWLEAGRAGNPHSGHRAGRAAADAIELARRQVAELLGAAPAEIVFTSGATEANNLALFGLSRPGGLVVTSAIEHPSVLACLPELEAAGRRCRQIAVDGDGRLDLDALAAALDVPACLVSVMAANNEIGTRQDLDAIAAIAGTHGACLHTDATQAPADAAPVAARGIAAASLSAHKIYGPAGIGALYVSRDRPLTARAVGGGQQGGRRAGTLPVAPIVGFGRAAALARAAAAEEAARLEDLAHRFVTGIEAAWPGTRRNGGAPRLPGCVHLTLPGIDAADLLLDLDEIAMSTGSACATGAPGPSHVLKAIGMSDADAHASIRVGLGRFTTADDVDHALSRFREALATSGRPAPG